MDLHTLSDPQARLILVLYAALLALGLVFLLMALTFIARAQTVRQRKQRARIVAAWRGPLLALQTLGRLPEALPPLRRADTFAFAAYWLEQLNQFEGHGRALLLELAKQLQLRERTQRYLTHALPGGTDKKALAVCLAGHLRHTPSATKVLRALHASEATLAFAACLALIRIDAPLYGAAVLKEGVLRLWGAPYVAKLLRELRKQDSPAEFRALLASLPHKQVRALLRAWASVDYGQAENFAREVLQRDNNEGWLLCGALELLRNPHDAALVRAYLKHPLWSVRVQAVKATAALGLTQDLERLQPLLKDETWWVRERAAEALARGSRARAFSLTRPTRNS